MQAADQAATAATGEDAAPPVVTALRPDSRAPYVLVCEHASNYIPPAYKGLGLGETDLSRHIAYDIGAAGVTRELSRLLDAPAFLSGRSRLLIDANRPPGSPTSIPEISEATVVPGNRSLDAAERQTRLARCFTPFHDAVAAHLDRRLALGDKVRVVAVHSFTPTFLGVGRPYHAGILFRGPASAWGERLVAALDGPERPTLANAPYEIEDDSDYLVPVQAEPRGLQAVLIEVRQDLIATDEAQRVWARTIAAALTAAG